jgi:hypothetical protein
MYRFNHRFNAHLKTFGLLVLLSLALVFGGPIGQSCSDEFNKPLMDASLQSCSAYSGIGTPLKPGAAANSLQIEAHPILAGALYNNSAQAGSSKIGVAMDVGLTGVFTPTTSASGGVRLTASNGVLPLDDLAAKGYVAVRVPHAPPTYTISSLIAGVNDWYPNFVEFSYYLPPTATIRTTVPITMVRRADLEPTVNSRWPITDGHSHWEVWWLPAGDRFPVPDQPFQLKKGWPQPIEIMFSIDFGAGTDASLCAGCPIEVVVYNGYVFIGPYSSQIVLENTPSPAGNPLVGFGARCGKASVVQEIAPTAPFTQTHWLESYDTVTRTYTLNATSSRGWNYTYYYQIGANPPVAAGLPFNVTLGPKPDTWPWATCAQIMAVYTPTLVANDAVRETFNITATSTVSPTMRASSVSFTLGPAYTLDEGALASVYYTLTIATTGTGSGTVIKSPDQISYTAGSAVILTATAHAGSTFAGWSGDADGSISPVTVTLNANKSVTATFNRAGGCDPIGGLDFTYTPIAPRAGQSVSFTGTIAAGTLPVTYTWSWGDATAADTGAFVHHSFPLVNTPTTYTVTLTAANVCGTAAPVEKTVTVQPHRLYLPLVVRLN